MNAGGSQVRVADLTPQHDTRRRVEELRRLVSRAELEGTIMVFTPEQVRELSARLDEVYRVLEDLEDGPCVCAP